MESFVDVDCSTDPLVWTEWRTAVVRGTSYSGNTVTNSLGVSDTAATYTFPDLILTILEPGDQITMVGPYE